jgi:AcrR family transcriptional regulator
MTSAPNRGPAAAAGNRAALIESARRLFFREGYTVPLSAIAKDAGVGQGTLYRHFPSREALAQAVIASTMDTLVEMTEELQGPDAFGLLWRHVIDSLVESVGFLEAVLGPRGELAGRQPERELATLLTQPFERAQEAGLLSGELTLDDAMLTLAMVHGAAHRAGARQARRELAYRALALVGGGLELD